MEKQRKINGGLVIIRKDAVKGLRGGNALLQETLVAGVAGCPEGRPLVYGGAVDDYPQGHGVSCHFGYAKALRGLSCRIVGGQVYALRFFHHYVQRSVRICIAGHFHIKEGDIVEADMDNGIIYNKTTGKQYKTAPFPDFVQKIIENGGLIQSIADGVIK